MKLKDIAEKIRSKNAGPFWVTIDIFCANADAFAQIRDGLSSARAAKALQTSEDTLKRFEIEALNVIKISLPRPAIQGSATDRDMHGAALANIIAELDLN